LPSRVRCRSALNLIALLLASRQVSVGSDYVPIAHHLALVSDLHHTVLLPVRQYAVGFRPLIRLRRADVRAPIWPIRIRRESRAFQRQ
jgi:hypothetical protein